jgi:hypothetical protein
VTSDWVVPVGSAVAPPAAARPAVTARRVDPLHQVVLPDAFVVDPSGISTGQFRRVSRLAYVRNVIAMDGGAVRIGGRAVNIIGVNPALFRAWTPLQTATQQSVWTALARGEFVTTDWTARQLGLRTGSSYRVAGARQPVLGYGGDTVLGVPAVDAAVNTPVSRQLGLVRQIGMLISAPGASLGRLAAEVRGVLGPKTRFISLLPALRKSQSLPVDGQVPGGRPDNYLTLYRDSAAMYCPGLSWTVLAAIGQIESGDGQNEGPSSAGALGPMQFLPSTWSTWGIDAFGESGTPDIMNPYDAVPSAAVYLCASGAARGGAALASAIFDYNHAAWYVAEVLALAHEYAVEYG